MRTSLRQPTPAERSDSKNNLTDEDEDWRNQAMRTADFDSNVDRSGDHRGGSFGRREDTSSTPTNDAYAERAPESHRPPDFLLKPPEPGQHPNFDARVAAEYVRLRGEKARGDIGANGETKETPPDRSSIGQSLGRSRDFEADVERAVRDLEHQLTVRRGPDNPSGSYSLTTPPRANGAETSIRSRGARPSSGPPRPSSQAVGDDDGGILSRMEAFRVPQGRGKGRSGGLKDMWKGEEGYISGNRNHERHGGGLTDMWKEAQGARFGGGAFPGGRRSFSGRQGPGIKSMWNGGDRESAPAFHPQRQGPGLRALWSGPDTAAGDAAKSDAQAAYLRALDRDVHERQAMSGDSPQQEHRRRLTLDRIEPSPGDVDDGVEFRFTRGAGRGRRRDDNPKDNGVRLASIGAPTGVPTSRGASRWPWELGGNEDQNRMFEKAKKAAYGEELRRQIAENEARKAAEKRASGRVHRRASTGAAEGRLINLHENDIEAGNGRPASSGPLVQHFQRDPQSPSSRSGRGGVADNWRAPSAVGESSATVQHSPGPANGGETDSHLTVARRRLVEQVYGGNGMGAALRGSGYRRRSTGGYGTVGRNMDVAVLDPIDDDDSVASADAANAATSTGAAYLRTGAGMQNLNETDHREKTQKRAAALEQQRALEEQISAKARAKKEEDNRRKREEEEEARQQQERLRQMDAEAEDERRRKQAEQQAQLDGLYRQQEEALRKKRVGTVNLRCRSDAGASPRDDRQIQSTRAPPSDGGFSDSTDQDLLPSHAQWTPEGETSPSSVHATTPRRHCGVPDVDDLPAGAQARAQVLHSSPAAADRPAASPSLNLRAFPIESPAGGNFTPRAERRKVSPAGIGASGPGARALCRSQSVPSSPALRSLTPRPNRHKGSSADVGPSVEAGAVPSPATVSRSPRVLGSRRGETRQEVIDRKKDVDEECCASSLSVASSVAPVGHGPTLALTDEAPLRTRSSLVPVESSTLFPASAGVDLLSLPEGDGEETTLACADADNGATTPAGTELASGFASRDAPQDEMDAFLTSWQAEHLGRRGQRATLAAEPNPHQCKAVGRFTGLGSGSTVGTSQPFRALRGSRAPSGNRGGRGAGNAWEEEQSMASISRSIDPSPPPLMDKETKRRNHEGVDIFVDEGERPLESDSVLFYLTGEHQQDSPNTSSLSPRLATEVEGPGSGQRESDQDQVSPLTRFLAETPVKLPDGATRAMAENRAAAQDRNSFAVGGGHQHGGGDLGVSRKVRGARALWRDRNWGGDGVADAFLGGGGGTPWEEIPDVGASS